jgi:hypothetical protein
VYFVGFYVVKLRGQNLTVLFMDLYGSLPHVQEPTTEAYPEQNETNRFLTPCFRKLRRRRLHLIKHWVDDRPGVWAW